MVIILKKYCIPLSEVLFYLYSVDPDEMHYAAVFTVCKNTHFGVSPNTKG